MHKTRIAIIALVCLLAIAIAVVSFVVFILPKPIVPYHPISAPSPTQTPMSTPTATAHQQITINLQPTPTPTMQSTFSPLHPIMTNIELYFNFQQLNVTNVSSYNIILESIAFNGTVNWSGNLFIIPHAATSFSVVNVPNTDLSITANYTIFAGINGMGEQIYYSKVFSP